MIDVLEKTAWIIKQYGGSLTGDCLFCSTATTYWHIPTNTPCCTKCASDRVPSHIVIVKNDKV